MLQVVLLAVYLTLWWRAVWLLTGRRDQFVILLFGVLICGLGVPVMTASLLAVNGYRNLEGIMLLLWALVPLTIVGYHWLRAGFGSPPHQ